MKQRLLSWLPLAVVALSLALTTELWRHEQQNRDEVLRSGFDLSLRQLASGVEQRMASYEQLLRGAQGLFEAGSAVTPTAFERYVDALLRGADHTGLRGLAWRPARLTAEQPAFSAPAASGLGGQDPLQDAVLATAMERARDSGQLALSAQTALHTPGQALDEPGFVLVLPVYEAGTTLTDQAQRRARLKGWVSASFVAGDMVSSLYGEGPEGLDLALLDGIDDRPDTTLYRSGDWVQAPRRATLSAREYLSFAGHSWTLSVRTQAEFERRMIGDSARVVAVAGVVLSLLLGLLTQSLVRGRAQAVGMARSAADELRESERRYQQIVEAASEGIWMTDPQGRTRFVNPRMAQMLGLSAEAVQDQPMDAFFLAPATGPVDPAGRLERRLRQPQGEPLWVTLSSSLLRDAAGQPAGQLTLVTDVGERKQAELRQAQLAQQLRESQKLEAVGTLAGGIAHDFNNILAAILGHVALARQQLDRGQDPSDSLQRIDESGRRARSLVQQILTFSRRQPPHLMVQPLQPLIEETAGLLRATLPASVRLTLAFPQEPLGVHADATQIQQVLMNLCTNAWHALPAQGGLVQIGLLACQLPAAAQPRLSALPAGPYALLWVRDDGCGMGPETLAHLFEPFFTTKGVGLGTGLGLSVVHGIVAAHQGAITVDSALGQGSCFNLYLSLVPYAEAGAPPTPPLAPADMAGTGRGERILLVDDDPAIVLIVERLLSLAGYQVRAFEDPVLALAALGEQPDGVDLVLSDFNMPGLSGVELARQCLALRPNLPVVISSGYLSEDVRQAALAVGVRELLQKEFSVEQLPELLRRVLDTR